MYINVPLVDSVSNSLPNKINERSGNRKNDNNWGGLALEAYTPIVGNAQ